MAEAGILSEQKTATTVDQCNGFSWQSWAGINATNFFLAEITGVAMPFANDFLKEQKWQPIAIGIATAVAGLGVFLMQTPAGFITDRIRQRRILLAAVSIGLGVCYGLLPLVPPTGYAIDSLLFGAGVAQAFFLPLLGALALGLVGHAGLGRMMGVNQGFNHAGNLAAALAALGLIAAFGLHAVFYGIFAVSVLAALSVFLIRTNELDESRASGDGDNHVPFWTMLRDRRILVLIASVALFHIANAPVMPLVAQQVRDLRGSHSQVALVVLVAQAAMIPVALLSGWLVERWGRKPVFAIAFAVLPVRIALYAFATTPDELIMLQLLDGIGAGIYGVVVVAICADLTHGKGGFNSLAGVLATALSIGGVIGPLGTGTLLQTMGYGAAYGVFAGIAAIGAVLFIGFMPETKEK